jgi:hypothetical protein
MAHINDQKNVRTPSDAEAMAMLIITVMYNVLSMKNIFDLI